MKRDSWILLFALATPLCFAQTANTIIWQSNQPQVQRAQLLTAAKGSSMEFLNQTASGSASTPHPSPLSDREQYGLRGPVKICVEETTYPGAIASSGTESKTWYQTEYEAEGRIVSKRTRNSKGTGWTIRYAYDASGKLLKTASGDETEPAAMTTYTYDDQGRQKSIVDSGNPDNPITFRYDEHGRKTKVQISRAVDYRPNVAVAGSPFLAADMRPNLPGGGTAVTTYDEYDRPIEVQVRDAQGEVVSRAVRIYNEQGQISEEKQLLDDPVTIIPADARAKILETSGASGEELREEITRLMGGQAGPFSTTYSCDAHGRINRTIQRIFNQEQPIETTYNEQGDVAVEITRSRQIGSETEQNAQPSVFRSRYSYQYDHHGNWTEKIVSYSSGLGGAFEPSTKSQRTLTYF